MFENQSRLMQNICSQFGGRYAGFRGLSHKWYLFLLNENFLIKKLSNSYSVKGDVCVFLLETLHRSLLCSDLL